MHQFIDKTLATICMRSLPGGGFSLYNDAFYRPDATAWAVMALNAGLFEDQLAEAGCRRLAASQMPDGQIPVIEGTPAYWPTFLAVMAWHDIARFKKETKKALDFLSKISGRHFRKKDNSPIGHDTLIKGWPWIEGTHSWIEPTSFSILALKSAGLYNNERVEEANSMIMDRQLSSGGWNYGNTSVFNKKLFPLPLPTGLALTAISGSMDRNAIESSIKYLQNQIMNVRTPLSLAWSIFGLRAWSIPLPNSNDWILESIALQEKYGQYDTALLSQLLLAYFTQGDLIRFLS